MSGLLMRQHDDAAALAGDVASAFLALLEEVQAAGGVPSVVLTGGTIADLVHREIARRSADSTVDWARVEWWWGDERYVPLDSADRNAGQARMALLNHVGIDPDRVHEMPADDGTPLEVAAARHEALLRAHPGPRYDLVMLGIGPDGHVASLFPGHPALSVTDRAVLGVPDSPKPPPARITLTLPELNRAGQVWFLVSGAEKQDAVDRLLGQPLLSSASSATAELSQDAESISRTPATGVHGIDSTILWTDLLPPPR